MIPEYKIEIAPQALSDIQQGTSWYNGQQPKLGSRYQNQVKVQINSLKHSPHKFRVRYGMVRCMPIKKFPFLVHFTIDENSRGVKVFAVFHTSRNPTVWIR